MKRVKFISCLIVLFSVMMIVPSVARSADILTKAVDAAIVGVESIDETTVILTLELSREDSDILLGVKTIEVLVKRAAIIDQLALAMAMSAHVGNKALVTFMELKFDGSYYSIGTNWRIGLPEENPRL